jgi:hypothetical protein
MSRDPLAEKSLRQVFDFLGFLFANWRGMRLIALRVMPATTSPPSRSPIEMTVSSLISDHEPTATIP